VESEEWKVESQKTSRSTLLTSHFYRAFAEDFKKIQGSPIAITNMVMSFKQAVENV